MKLVKNMLNNAKGLIEVKLFYNLTKWIKING